MSEETSDKTSEPTPLKPGEKISGMTVVDPIADMEDHRTIDKPAPPAKKKVAKKATSSKGPSIESVVEDIRKALDDENLQVEELLDHPRSPIVTVKRLPDVTRPVAYLDSGDGSWAAETLTLNLYGFLDPSTMEAIQGPIRSALKLSDRQVSSFTRF